MLAFITGNNIFIKKHFMNRKNKTVKLFFILLCGKIATIVIYLFWGGYLLTEWFCYLLDGWLGCDFFPSRLRSVLPCDQELEQDGPS